MVLAEHASRSDGFRIVAPPISPAQRLAGWALISARVWALGWSLFVSGYLMAAQTGDPAAPVHPVDGSFVREWLVLGPFPSKEINIDLLAGAGGEANVRPKEGDAVTMPDGTRLTWTRLRSKDDWVSSDPAVGVSGLSIAYAYCELQTDQPCETEVRWGYYNPSFVWLNGKSVSGSNLVPGSRIDDSPVLPIRLGNGRNACLLKLPFDVEPWQFLFQPLPPSRARVDLQVTDAARKNIHKALVQFYDQGELVMQLRTDEFGKAVASLYPLAATYDLRVTYGETGTWLSDVAFLPGEQRKLDVSLQETVSISGQVLAMDGSPQSAIVVQAIPMGSSTNSTFQRRSKKLPSFSETVLTDTTGVFRFVNLRRGHYWLRAHSPDGFVAPMNPTNALGLTTLLVESGRPQTQLRFVFPEAKKGNWKILPVAQGLRAVPVLRIQPGPDGRLWIGTSESFLYAYDGLEMKLMASSPEIPGNVTHALHFSADGTLWVGTIGGISRSGEGGMKESSFNMSLLRKPITSIITGADGTLWFGGQSGLFQYAGGKLIDMTARKGLPSAHVNSLLRGRDGSIWVATFGGIVRFDGARSSRLDPFHGFSQRRAERLYQARDDAIWFSNAIDAPGAYRHNGKNWDRIGSEDGLLSDQVFGMAETSDGSIWFATSEGLSRLKGETVVNFTEHDGLGARAVYDIYADSDDVLWCATAQGVLRFDTKGFIRFTKQDGLDNSGGGTLPIFALEPDPSGGFWVGTEWGGLFHLDGDNLHSVVSDPPARYFRQIHRSRDGTCWFGTDIGIFKLESGRAVRTKALENRWIIALGSDDQGNFWYGHGWQGDGVSRFNPKTGETASFTTANGLPDNQVWSIAAGAEGAVWIGTSSGLARYRDGRMEDFREKLGIPTGAVFSLRRDTGNVLWISSRLGLHRLQGDERVSITATNGLPDQHVWCSARTQDGVIWMGTDRGGLLGYDGKAVTMIDRRDGLVGDRVFAIASDTDESLLLGFADGGLTRYRRTKTPPSVHLLAMQLNNQVVTNFAELPKIVTGNRVTFQYREIDLKTHPEKRQFSYRVAEPSGETVFAAVTKERHFDWTPQKGGAYTFEVQAIDRDLNYSAPVRLRMHVTVPWHANAWILTPVAGAFGGLLVWACVGLALYLRKSREAVLLQERVRIARDLHDHLGAGLTDLALAGDLVRQQIEQPGPAQIVAARLSESARELTRTMGEAIWIIDPDKDTLRSFLSFISNYAERFFAGSALRLRFEFPAEVPNVILSAELRRSLLMVVKEALNNLAKHSGASELRIKMELCDHDLLLSIEDDGRGFLMTEVAADRHGLVNMQQRMRDLGGQLRIESAVGRGTRVYARLPLPRK